MSERTLKWLVGALAVVVVAWAAVTLLGGRRRAPAGSAKLTAFFKGLTQGTVASVHIVGPKKDTIDLVQKDAVWKVNGARTDSAAVVHFWTDVKNARLGDLVATNPANHARLGVAADNTWKLTFDVSGGARTLYVGKIGPTYTSVYVRLPDQNSVYTLDGGLRSAVVRTVADWRDHRIVSLDTASVVHIVVKHGRGSYHVVRKDSVWEFQKGPRVDTSTVHEVLSELSDLVANGFYHAGDSLPAQAGSLVALNGVGDTLTVLDVGSGEGDRWVRARGDTTVYRVAGYRIDRMMPKRETLEGKPAKKTTVTKPAPAKAPAKKSRSAKAPAKAATAAKAAKKGT